ncbi:ribonuclease P protein subunit p38-like [Ylistrum balloti]|uniref:ribonuclease P protein subunit p38-like n=1 Tax=Ylistrum balloti TaxID=509963 RepID=UPI002905EC9A|nr:ribonuclease P protein subunit p38-like [Ylistrum balloti]
MSAPTLTKRQIQQTLRKGNSKQTSKTVLSNPYNKQWPTVQDDVQQEILHRLISTLKSLDIARPKSCKKRKKTEDTEKDTVLPVDEEKQSIRKQLLFGVNQVTRGLEKDEVRLVMTCRSAQPVIITRHMIGLSSLRGCPAICINDLNKSLCEVMNMTSAVAVAFKKKTETGDPSVFDDLVEFVVKNAPEITLPWLAGNSGDISNTELVETGTADAQNRCCDQDMKEVAVAESDPGNISHNASKDKEKSHVIQTSVPLTESSVEKRSDKVPTDSFISHKKQADKTPVDYSRFYVYKSEATTSMKKWPEFLKFSSDPEESVDYKSVDYKNVTINESTDYKKVSVKRIPSNPERKKKKRKLKK